jgi:polyphosphate kinase
MVDQIKQKDILLSYPFENIKSFIRLLNEASFDDSVVSIKITLYRVARHSQIIEALVNAAENGKDVLVLVELRARFDEENNIGWSKRLEEAGCTVIYGPKNIKVHSKLLLITRKTKDGTEYITQVGTGNYNEKTSTLYTDLSLMTANVEIGLNALEVFNALSLGHLVESSNHLLVAPNCLQNRVIEMIDYEIELAKLGQPSYIGIKINSLSDKKIILKLVEASKAGVKVDLIIRGICCLISGVKGETENITVHSIVGRYLEHSRIYIFGTHQRSKIYISSADYMTRNTVRRVEVAVPIYDSDIKERLWNMFQTLFNDNVKTRVQLPDGTYKKVKPKKGEEHLDSQIYFYNQAYENAKASEEQNAHLKKTPNNDGSFFNMFLKQS